MKYVVAIVVVFFAVSTHHASAADRPPTPPVFADAATVEGCVGPTIARLVRPPSYANLSLDVPPTPDISQASAVAIDGCSQKRQQLFVLLNENNFEGLVALLKHMTGCTSASFKNTDGESLLYCALRAYHRDAVMFCVWCGADVLEVIDGVALIDCCDESCEGAAIRDFLLTVIEALPGGESVSDIVERLYPDVVMRFKQIMEGLSDSMA